MDSPEVEGGLVCLLVLILALQEELVLEELELQVQMQMVELGALIFMATTSLVEMVEMLQRII
jgi:hypothetical protein